ncbi:MAG: hypothetical protein JWR80_9985 [Bradyrhizobium sp.]|nr:hypothetical protein [Bradyrhizobium sp.]
MKCFAFVVAFLLATLPAQAQYAGFGAPSLTTQTTLTDNVVMQSGIAVSTGTPAFTSTAGKTSVPSPTLPATTLVLIVAGDSIAANSLPTPRTPTNTTAVLQLNIYDNTVYQAKDPLLGASGLTGGNYATYLADKLVTDAKFAQVILVPVDIGGTTSFDWSPDGLLHQRARVACWLIRGKGWLTNSNLRFGTIYNLGVNEAPLGTTSAQFQARYNAWLAAMVAYGCDFDTFVPVNTRLSNVTNATIAGAQAAVVGGKTYAGPNTDTLTATGSNLQADNTHLSDAGGSNNANLWATIIEAHYLVPPFACNDNTVDFCQAM